MTTLDRLLDLVPGIATRAAPTPEDGNVLLLPDAPGTAAPGLVSGDAVPRLPVPANVKHGELKHPDAGPPGGDALPARVVAVLGPGATFRGLAAALLPTYTANTPAGIKALTTDELAMGLVVYNAKTLPTSSATWSDHKVGLCLPLPIELDAAGAWTLNAQFVRDSLKAFSSGKAKLDKTPKALDVLEPAQIEGEAGSFFTPPMAPGRPDLQWNRALRNPSDAVLTIFAILRKLVGISASRPAAALNFVLAFLERAQPHHVAMLAATRAGNGILRRLAMAIPPPAAGDSPQLKAARSLVDNALFTGTGAGRKLVPHSEVPATTQLLAVQAGVAKPVLGATADPGGGLQRLVLGRQVAAGRIDAARVGGVKYSGPEIGGRLPLDPFLKDDAAGLADPKVQGLLALQALERTRPNPFDAVRARGPGSYTVGLDSWSALDAAGTGLNPTGLAALLARFKDIAPDEFDLYFRTYRLDAEKDAADPSKARLKKVGDDGKTSASPMTAEEVRKFLDGTGDPTKTVTYTADWAARLRLPALVSRQYRRAQVLLVTDRMKRTADPVEGAIALVNPFPAPYTLAFDTGAGSKSEKLKAKVDAAVGPFLLGLPDDLDSKPFLSGALIDLTGAPAKPAYAASHAGDDEDTFYIGSMGKAAAMYAAFELRFRLRNALVAAQDAGLSVTVPNWHVKFLDIVRKTWSGRVTRGYPRGFPTPMPKFTDMFTFTTVPSPPGPPKGHIEFTSGTATDEQIIALDTGSLRADMKFLEMIKSMIFMSNAHGADQVITRVGYAYLNGVLREGGFFDPDPRSTGGIWISGSYDSHDWTKDDVGVLSTRGQHHYKPTTNFVGNAKQFAILLALADRHALFDGHDAAGCGQMIDIMRRFALTPTDPRPDADDSFIRDAVKHAHVVDESYSKIGIGIERNGHEGVHDCAIIQRKKGATTLRYVMVVVGGYGEVPDSGRYDDFVRVLDGALAAVH